MTEERGQSGVAAGASLAETIAQAARCDPTVAAAGPVLAPAGDAWQPVAEIDTARLLDGAQRGRELERRDIAAQWLVEWVAWLVAHPAVALLLRGRAPDVGPDNVLLRFDEVAQPLGLGLREPRFAALPGDGAASDPYASIVDGEAAQRRWLRAAIEATLAPVVEAVAADARRPRRALWRGASDRVAAAFLDAGMLAGVAPQRASDLGRAFLDGPGPLQAAARYVPVAAADGPRWTHLRNGCCLYHRLPDAEPCFTCPLLDEAGRLDQLARGIA